MTRILGTLTDSAGTPLDGELEITLDAPLIDTSTAPDTILVPQKKTKTITNGALDLDLAQSETGNITYHFLFNTFREEVQFYFQNGEQYGGPNHQHTDGQWYTGLAHTGDNQLLSRYTAFLRASVMDFHAIVPNQADVEFASLLPTGITTDVLDTSIRRLAQILTSNTDYAAALQSGFRWQGEYDASTYYQRNDAVSYQGGSWIYTHRAPTFDNTPSKSSNFWQLMTDVNALVGERMNNLLNRTPISVTTAVLNPKGKENVTVALGKSFFLLAISTSSPAWVRIYATPEYRTKDTARDWDKNAAAHSGIIAEVITNSNLLNIDLEPIAVGASLENLGQANIAIAITNLGAFQAAITVNFKKITLET